MTITLVIHGDVDLTAAIRAVETLDGVESIVGHPEDVTSPPDESWDDAHPDPERELFG